MSTRSISLAVLAVSLIVIAFLALCGESEETRRAREKQAEDARRAERQHKTTREENCRLVTEALGIVEARGRGDLAAPKGRIEACRRLVIEDCDYKVELQYELTKAGAAPLALGLEKIGEDCSDELRFALKYGLEAFRDHRKLVESAVDQTAEEAKRRDEDAAAAESDYYARGR